MLAGLAAVSDGSIEIGGSRVDGLQSQVRVLFQDARLLPWQRVLQNVGIGRGHEWRRRAKPVLDDVGLGDRARDWPAVLSGGQRQRVALARALVTGGERTIKGITTFLAFQTVAPCPLHSLTEEHYA